MVLTLEPGLEVALSEATRKAGVSPEELASNALRERFLARIQVPEPRDEWERSLLALAKVSGVSLSNGALSREEMYD